MTTSLRVTFCLTLLLTMTSHSSERYFLCGPDEDGCYPQSYQYCSCIPYNDLEANSPYCLDFDKLTCIPLSQSPNCPNEFIFANQAQCLATIFQSEPLPPCTVTSKQFCLEHHTFFCDVDGQPLSCHH